MKQIIRDILIKTTVLRNKLWRIYRNNEKVFIVFFVAVFLVLTSIIAGTIYGYIRTTMPIEDSLLSQVKLNTKIYDASNNEISTLKSEENRDWVSISGMPDKLQKAFVAIEDRRFFEHSGIDYWGFVRAIFNKIFHPEERSEGASTITMQVVKNLTNEKDYTMARKVQEQTRASQLEHSMTKKEILELYLNLICLGDGNYGVKTAAKAYFGKDDLNQLTLAECACLASITQTPAKYAPVTDSGRKENLDKQKTVLKYMLDEEFITQDEYNSAVEEKVTFLNQGQKKKVVQSYFVDNLINEIVTDFTAKKGMNEKLIKNEIYSGGWKIYTTQDSKVQKAVDEVYNDPKSFPADGITSKYKNAKYQIQSGMVIINPETAEIVALYGGNGAKTVDMAFSNATQLNRNPGSSFKPIIVYGPGIDMNTFGANTIIDDAECFLDPRRPKTPYPKNFDGEHHGPMPIRDGLKTSNNVVAAKAWNMMDKQQAFNYLKKSGIDAKFNSSASVALGGNFGASPLKMAAAYVPFVKKGIYTEPISYTKIIDRDGKVLIDKKKDPVFLQKSTNVYKPETAKTMISMMEDVFKPGGTASYVQIANSQGQAIPAGGKTGTTDNDTDRWLVGFTPYYVAAVWFGDKNNLPLPTYDFNPSAIIWKNVMNRIHADVGFKDFQ